MLGDSCAQSKHAKMSVVLYCLKIDHFITANSDYAKLQARFHSTGLNPGFNSHGLNLV